jgi:hypothetical protein
MHAKIVMAIIGMDAAADADHLVVAYPQALIPAGTGFDWNVPGVYETGRFSAKVTSGREVRKSRPPSAALSVRSRRL